MWSPLHFLRDRSSLTGPRKKGGAGKGLVTVFG